MSAGLEWLPAQLWIEETLRSDPVLKGLVAAVVVDSYRGEAFPIVKIDASTQSNLPYTGKKNYGAQSVWAVRAIGRTQNVLDLAPIAERIYELLHGGGGTSAYGTTWSCRFLQPLRLSSLENDEFEFQLGGTYVGLSR